MKVFFAFILSLCLFSTGYAQITYRNSMNNQGRYLFQYNNGQPLSSSILRHNSLLFRDDGGITINRMFLDKSSLNFINGGSWGTVVLSSNGSGSSGELRLSSGGGTGSIFYAGPDYLDPTRGRLYLYDNNSFKTEMRIIEEAGVVNTQGSDGSDNTSLTYPSGRPDVGYVTCEDSDGQIQAGLIINAAGTGEVFGDTKNFRMEHPEQPGKEIWYASLEGPEAAAYERGSAALQYGEAFIPFSDHFQLVINPETMTVILTPHSADTYGLAVVAKTSDGFRVKELRGGKGNFGFDWEVKAVRKGYEDYRVIRDSKEMLKGGQQPGRTVGQGTSAVQDKHTQEASGAAAEEQLIQLGQNRPNPTKEMTIIPYTIPKTAQTAELQLFDAQGKLIQQYALSPAENGRLELPTNVLAPGMYVYSLFINGDLKSSRQMVIAR